MLRSGALNRARRLYERAAAPQAGTWDIAAILQEGRRLTLLECLQLSECASRLPIAPRAASERETAQSRRHFT